MRDARTHTTDVLVIGGGGAGERAALEAARKGARVTIVSKGPIAESGCTTRALSELSAYSASFGHSDPRDKPYYHFRDTVDQGAGLADEELVRILALDAPKRLEEIVKLGGTFRTRDGRFEQLLADASTLPRACHAGADTGREIAQALKREILKHQNIEVHERAMVVRLLTYAGAVVGAVGLDLASGEVTVYRAKSTVLASGGGGQIFSLNAQPSDITGEGYALAYEAGARLVNMEFIQIGPALVHPVQGYLLVTRYWRLKPRIYNAKGEEFLGRYLPPGVNPDEVIRSKEFAFPFIINYPAMYLDIAMHTEIKEGRGTEHGGVYLDVSHNPASLIEETVPVSFKWLIDRGVDIRKDPIEVAPVVQCFIGGVKVNARAETTAPGLFACGEVEGGLHGAARPGGNLLAGGQVFGTVAGVSAAERALPIESVKFQDSQVCDVMKQVETWTHRQDPVRPDEVLAKLRKTMWDNVSVVRNAAGLQKTLEEIEAIERNMLPRLGCTNPSEVAKAIVAEKGLVVARIIALAALLRKESRGTHYREDFPETGYHNWTRTISFEFKNGVQRVWASEPAKLYSFYVSQDKPLSSN